MDDYMSEFEESQFNIAESQMQGECKHQVKVQDANFQNFNIDELYGARVKLRNFIEEIGLNKNTNVRKDVMEHCDKFPINISNYICFEKVERMVKNRIEKMIKNKRIKKNWSEEDVLILVWIISKFADWKGIRYIQNSISAENWDFIASLIPGVTGENCMFKWLGLKKNNLSVNSWTDRQSYNLDYIVRTEGEQDWNLIAQKLYYSSSSSHRVFRCPKQCRQHWNCYLNPKLKKGPWSLKQDILLLATVQKNNGLKKWSQMVKLFNGRTQNALKNRFTLLMEKQMRNHVNGKKMSELQLIEHFLNMTYVEQFVSKDKEQVQYGNKHKILKKGDYGELQENNLNEQNPVVMLNEKDNNDEEIIKIESMDCPHSLFYPQQLQIKKKKNSEQILLSQQVPTFPEIKIEDEQKCEKKILDLNQLPEIKNVRVVPLNKQLLENLLNSNDDPLGFVPCAILADKLTKLQY